MTQLANVALDAQTDVRRALDKPRVAFLTEAIMQHKMESVGGASLDTFVQTAKEVLEISETYALHSEIIDDLWAIRNEQPYIEHLSVDMLPAKAGFVYLEKPIHTTDLRDKPFMVNAVSWWVSSTWMEAPPDSEAPFLAAPTIMLVWWSDPYDDDNYLNHAIQNMMGEKLYRELHGRTLTIADISILPLDEAAAYELMATEQRINSALLPPMDSKHWATPVYDGIRFLVGFWRFATTDFLREEVQPTRPARRRAERVLRGSAEHGLKVVRISKRWWPGDGSTEARYDQILRTHRWWRRGHPRKVRDRKTKELKRMTWVRGHWCGPEDLPERKPDVYEVME